MNRRLPALCGWLAWLGLLSLGAEPILNEVVSSNISGPPDEYEEDLQNCPVPDCEGWYEDLGRSNLDGEYPDWIELYNPSETAVDLFGYGLSDDPELPFKWTFPNVALEPGAYLMVFASGKDKQETFIHTNFKLRRSGEHVLLTAPNGDAVDAVELGEIPVDFSLGRKSDATWGLFAQPTPAAENTTPVFPGFSDVVTMMPAGGVFERLPQVELTSENAAAEIRFTTNGSVPTVASPLFKNPIRPLFAANLVIRARSFVDGQPASRVRTQTYLSGRTFTMPVISLTTAPDNLFDEETGIYTPGSNANEGGRVANYWNEWERPVHIEFFEPDGTLGFQLDAGMRMFGWGSRSDPQKSLSIMARDKYGTPEIEYSIFPGHPITEFKSLVLRAAGSDSRSNGTFFRDPFATSLVKERNVDIQAMRPAVVYLNGDYWGIHNIREKMNEDYLASHHGVDPDEVDIVSRYWRRRHVVVIEGDAESYDSLEAFLSDTDLSEPANYAEANRRIDMDNLLDYMTAQIYLANFDWPGNNNKAWRPREGDAKWRSLMYDMDYTMAFNGNNPPTHNTLRHAMAASGSGWPNPSWTTLFLRTLSENETFRHAFGNRMADLMNTVFAPEQAVAKLDAMQLLFEPEMEHHLTRWKREGDSIGSISTWERNINTVRSFLERRPEQVFDHVKEAFQLGEAITLTLNTSSTSAGRIELNSIMVDAFPWSGQYHANSPLAFLALPNPGYRFSHWTGLEGEEVESRLDAVLPNSVTLTAHFEAAPKALNTVVINEINYLSSGLDGPGDWVELYNGYEFPIDISGYILRDNTYGHRFLIPEGTQIEPTGYLVLCQDLESFNRLHPGVPSEGPLPFNLRNGGDTVRLYDRQRHLVDSIEYDDDSPWPLLEEGKGHTLVLVDPSMESQDPNAWMVSVATGGSPGAANAVAPPKSQSAWARITHDAGNHTFTLGFPGAEGRLLDIERSTNLLEWSIWKAATSERNFQLSEDVGKRAYFRAKQVP